MLGAQPLFDQVYDRVKQKDPVPFERQVGSDSADDDLKQ
jgi:hypothetical protein